MRDELTKIVQSITPFDALEKAHTQDVLEWIQSGADLYRIQKPDVPPKHLVSYFAVYDPVSNKILLQDHLLAKAWLAPGGHVEPDEDPVATVHREAKEELGIRAEFLRDSAPEFITVTTTNGQGEHTDVSLWYILKGDENAKLTLEENAFAEVRWWPVEEILQTPIEQFDAHMHRFITKMRAQNIFS